MVILVTGANGQLGQAIKSRQKLYPEMEFIFLNSNELDITNLESCKTIFNKYTPNFCINTAGYTQVDKAESEIELAIETNVQGVKNLATVSLKHNTTLIHISTDFVFDGNTLIPYTENQETNPINVYGKSKLMGEIEVQKNQKYYIIRTSWLFSEFGNNFKKTIIRLASEKSSLNIVNDQIGTPTNAKCLADFLIFIIQNNNSKYGIYNFSNLGSCSWYDFATEIITQNGITTQINPISTSQYPTPAARPKFSVLDKSKIKEVFNYEPKLWQEVINY